MSNPFVGEIRMVGFNFAPQGWAFCSGQTMSIAQNDVLFALIGTIYGGDGVNTFQLPDLQGRIPIHQGKAAVPPITSSASGGSEAVTLISSQLPLHNHVVGGAAGLETSLPSGLPASGGPDLYATGTGTAPTMGVMPTGGNQPHENMAPFLTINFVISLFGIFPSRN